MKTTFLLTMTDSRTGILGCCVFEADAKWTVLEVQNVGKMTDFRPSVLNEISISTANWDTYYKPPPACRPGILACFWRAVTARARQMMDDEVQDRLERVAASVDCFARLARKDAE